MATIRKVASRISSNLLRYSVRNACINTTRERMLPQKQMTSIVRDFSTLKPNLAKEKVTVHFIQADGTRHTVNAKVGDNLLDIVIDNDVDLDGFGACEGTLACSTCHLIFKQADYDNLPDTPSDEELDMLDLAYGLEDTSRLGCQVILTKDMEGLEVTVPVGTSDARG